MTNKNWPTVLKKKFIVNIKKQHFGKRDAGTKRLFKVRGKSHQSKKKKADFKDFYHMHGI